MTTAQLHPHMMYRSPERVPDGEGGYTYGTVEESLIYLSTSYDSGTLTATLRSETDLTLKDVIMLGGEFYEVSSCSVTNQEHYKRVGLLKIDKPIYVNGL